MEVSIRHFFPSNPANGNKSGHISYLTKRWTISRTKRYMNRANLLFLSLAGFLLLPVTVGGGLNPDSPGLPAVDNVYGRNGIAGNGASAMCLSCHSATPIPGETAHFVAHFSAKDGANRTTTPANIPLKERTGAWTGSGASSKYGNFLTWTSDNTTRGELICESCHNLLRNVAGGNNLLESSLPSNPRPGQPNDLNSATTTICEGCHVTGTLPGHHPMTGDGVTGGGVLSTVDTVSVRGYVSSGTEMGGAGSGVFYPAAAALPCLSCHGNGHAGYAGTGARILRRGYSRDSVTVGAYGTGVAGADNTGIDRQYDIDSAGVNRLIRNFAPLCDACHKTDD